MSFGFNFSYMVLSIVEARKPMHPFDSILWDYIAIIIIFDFRNDLSSKANSFLSKGFESNPVSTVVKDSITAS